MRILIVEDEGLLTISIDRWLKSFGYDIQDIVTSAQDAIKSAEKQKPDLILMDILLQGEMDGIMAVEAIHKREYVPVIYLTACHDIETIQRANKTKHSGYMQKPVSKDDLELTVAAILKKESN
jgi:CheY-like chemotaxis protein